MSNRYKIDIKKEMLKNPLIVKKVLKDLKETGSKYAIEYRFIISTDDIINIAKENCDKIWKEIMYGI